VHKYRSLEAWKRAHAAVLLALEVTDGPNPPRTWNVFDQMRRAIVSVEANIVEGYALGTVPLYRRHLRIALGSAAEAECLLNIAAERNYLPPQTVARVLEPLGGSMKAIIGLLRRAGTG